MEQDSDNAHSDSDEEVFQYSSIAADDSDAADYSARLDEILSDDDELEDAAAESEVSGEFYYTGKDASEIPSSYQEQMRDVLDGDHDSVVHSDDEQPSVQQQSSELVRDKLVDEWAGQDSSYFTAVSCPGGSFAVVLIYRSYLVERTRFW